MAINIGTDAAKATIELRGNKHFGDLLDALIPVIQKRQLDAARSAPELRIHHTSHADGMYELWESLYGVYADLHPGRVPLPRRGRPPNISEDVNNAA